MGAIDKETAERYVDQMTPEQLREFAVIGFMWGFSVISNLLGKRSQEKP